MSVMHLAEFIPWVLKVLERGAVDAGEEAGIDLRGIPVDDHVACRLAAALMVGQCVVASGGYTIADVREAEAPLVAEMTAARIVREPYDTTKEG